MKKSIQNEIKELEQLQSHNFLENNSLNEFEHYPIETPYYFLYHGINHGNPIKKLENILKEKKILAGNNLDSSYYIPYDDNCNDGNYISLLEYQNREDITYKIFIIPNITLIIKPIATAIKTIYVPYETWTNIKLLLPEHKNRYSYARNEYQVKNFIPLESIAAIGIPYHYLIWTKHQDLAKEYENKILKLLEKYQISLPIIDTSWKNKIIIPANEYHKTKTLKKELNHQKN